ncbi:uncharacterized protein FA14DRAFT_192170 [Meira miltonrushii]|uniref:GPI transamidase component PIG-S n=1 Tax=Meira miltonrushii TaxID=1280837 RepID=A0A316V8U4_9BASI|nr:uncharacterized protein FA14DRAFT_192170 [Meira miltonrushii]PWN31885.1 hypothetical protein FA14DRAFT_192170 [Meira miltonrushii]
MNRSGNLSQKGHSEENEEQSLITWTSSKPIFQTLKTRAWILICFYTTVVLSLPFWLQTTTIERLPLPREDVQRWEATLPCPVRFRHTLTLRLPAGIVAREHEAIVAQDLAKALKAAGDGVWTNEKVQHTINGTETFQEVEQPIPLEHAACIDWNVRMNEVGKLEPSSLHYVITIAHGDATESFLSTSTTRHFTINSAYPLEGRPHGEVAWSLASQLSRFLQLPYRDLFFQESFATIGQASHGSISTENVLQRIGVLEMDKRQIPYTRNVRMVFTLVNEDVSSTEPPKGHRGTTSKRQLSSGVAGWDEKQVSSIFKKKIAPLTEALYGTHKLVTEMQTIWYAPLQFQPVELEIPKILEAANVRSAKSRRRRRKSVPSAVTDDGKGDDDGKNEDEIDDLLDEEDSKSEVKADVPEVVEKDIINLIRQDDLQIFVNAGEWGLSSSGNEISQSEAEIESQKEQEMDLESLIRQKERTLHFVVYVPKPSHRPLRIAADEQNSNISAATGWLVPQWGGVSLYNLGHESHEVGRAEGVHSDKYNGKMLNFLNSNDLDKAFTSFDKQLRSLLGLRRPTGISEAEEADAMPSSDARLALALDALVRRRTIGSMRESVRTLASIIRLVDKIKILGVGSQVQDDVRQALKMLQTAADLRDDQTAPILRQGSSSPVPAPLSPLRALLDLHHSAELLSSRAFFNPAMLGQLYFPDEHKYAVYTPLFGPLAMPLLVAAIRLIKERRARSKKEAKTRSESVNTTKKSTSRKTQ